MRALKWLFLIVVVAALAVGYIVLAPYGPRSEQYVDISPGTSTAQMAQQLHDAGIIRSAAAFEGMRFLRSGSLKAGEYRFDHPATLTEVYDRLRRGDVYAVTVVIPEGYNLFDIAAAIEKAGLRSHDDFLTAARQHTELIKAWSPHATSLEGYLFPDTYKFGHHETSQDMLATMVKRFDIIAARLNLQPENAARIVTMASLVEKEVHVDSERPEVAGVFENRLAQNMPLQTDPTVIYASMLAGTWTGTIHQSELHSDSPYNTYAHTGLPPGPICNPGVASLKAAMHPQPTDSLYFVANTDGTTRFAKTLEEHNANVANYRAATGQGDAEGAKVASQAEAGAAMAAGDATQSGPKLPPPSSHVRVVPKHPAPAHRRVVHRR